MDDAVGEADPIAHAGDTKGADGIWAKGGLKGGKPSQAFFVKCDETNNPQQVIDRGQLICQIGVAIAAPMEFLVFEMRRSVEGQQVVEA